MCASGSIAFFGGTFDPIHLGHLEVAIKARESFELDEVIFLPCRRSPHKTEAPGASDADRLEMLKRATAGQPGLSVDDYELTLPPPSYTWKTIRTLKDRHPAGTRVFLLIGLDQWEALPRWRHPERLAEDLEFIVVGRDGYPEPRKGYRAHFLKGDHPASATVIRAELAAGKSSRWLPDPVSDYIRAKALYSQIP